MLLEGAVSLVFANKALVVEKKSLIVAVQVPSVQRFKGLKSTVGSSLNIFVLQKSRFEPAIYPSPIQQRQRPARWGSELAFPSGRASISFIAFLLSKYVAACSILRLVELAFDPAAHVARAFGLRQTLVEHELGNARRRRDFRLQDIGLARERHALGAQLGADLIGTRLSSENMSLRRPAIRNGSRICVWLLRAKPATPLQFPCSRGSGTT